MQTQRLAILLLALCSIAARPAPEKIDTLDQLRAAAVHTEVAAIEFTVPASETEAERALSNRYFNQPLEQRFSGVTATNVEQKWDLLASVLVEKAEQLKLDAKSLEACLRALNHGHSEENMLVPVPPEWMYFPPGETPEKTEQRKREAKATYEALLQERKEHPERFAGPDIAIPVGAYLATHAKGSCWVIVCKWEMNTPDEPLGHVRVWAVDTVTHKTVAYATCD